MTTENDTSLDDRLRLLSSSTMPPETSLDDITRRAETLHRRRIQSRVGIGVVGLGVLLCSFLAFGVHNKGASTLRTANDPTNSAQPACAPSGPIPSVGQGVVTDNSYTHEAIDQFVQSLGATVVGANGRDGEVNLVVACDQSVVAFSLTRSVVTADDLSADHSQGTALDGSGGVATASSTKLEGLPGGLVGTRSDRGTAGTIIILGKPGDPGCVGSLDISFAGQALSESQLASLIDLTGTMCLDPRAN